MGLNKTRLQMSEVSVCVLGERHSPLAHNVDVILELRVVDLGARLKAAHGHLGLCVKGCTHMQAAGTLPQSELKRHTHTVVLLGSTNSHKKHVSVCPRTQRHNR